MKEKAPRFNKGRKPVLSPAPENSQHTPIVNSVYLPWDLLCSSRKIFHLSSKYLLSEMIDLGKDGIYFRWVC